MKGAELKILRKLLFLSVKEASLHIANHKTARTWQFYESDQRNIPADVINLIEYYLESRQEKIEFIDDLLAERDFELVEIDFYQSSAEYMLDHKNATFVDFRIHQSIASHFLSQGLAELKLRYN